MKINKILILLIFLLSIQNVYAISFTLPFESSLPAGQISNGNGYIDNESGYFNYTGNRNIYLITTDHNTTLVEPISYALGQSSYLRIASNGSQTLRYAEILDNGDLWYVTSSGVYQLLTSNRSVRTLNGVPYTLLANQTIHVWTSTNVYSVHSMDGQPYFYDRQAFKTCELTYYTCHNVSQNVHFPTGGGENWFWFNGVAINQYYANITTGYKPHLIDNYGENLTSWETTSGLLYPFVIVPKSDERLLSFYGENTLFRETIFWNNLSVYSNIISPSSFNYFPTSISETFQRDNYFMSLGSHSNILLFANTNPNPDVYDYIDVDGHGLNSIYVEPTPTPTPTPTPLPTACPTCTDKPHDIGDNELSTYFFNLLFIAWFLYILAFILTIGDKK